MKQALQQVLQRRQLKLAQKLKQATERVKQNKDALENSKHGSQQIIDDLQTLNAKVNVNQTATPKQLLDQRDQQLALKKTLKNLLQVQGMLHQEVNKAVEHFRQQASKKMKLEHKQERMSTELNQQKKAQQRKTEQAQYDDLTQNSAKPIQ